MLSIDGYSSAEHRQYFLKKKNIALIKSLFQVLNKIKETTWLSILIHVFRLFIICLVKLFNFSFFSKSYNDMIQLEQLEIPLYLVRTVCKFSVLNFTIWFSLVSAAVGSSVGLSPLKGLTDVVSNLGFLLTNLFDQYVLHLFT